MAIHIETANYITKFGATTLRFDLFLTADQVFLNQINLC